MIMPDVSTLTLNNGVELPALGLGVFQTPAEETRAAVEAAISAGYRHIDTAAAYGNERQVGEAVRSSGLDRSEVFLETKIWISDYGYDKTLHGFEKSARKLGVDQIDLLLRPAAHCRTRLRCQCVGSQPRAQPRPRLGSRQLVSGTPPDPARASRRRC